MARAQHGAEQLLSAAGLGDDAISGVSEAILRAAESESEVTPPADLPARRAPVAAAPEAEEAEAAPEQPAAEPGEPDETGDSPQQQQ
jgi:hypothetical protein